MKIRNAALALVALTFLAAPAQAGDLPESIATGLANVVATDDGFSLDGIGFTPWGQTAVIDHLRQVEYTQIGGEQDFCRLGKFGFRTYNASDHAAGVFHSFLYRGSKVVFSAQSELGAYEDELEGFTLDLKEGTHVFRLKVDAADVVNESDEDNTYSVKIKVLVDCDGDGQIAGKPSGAKIFGSKAQKQVQPTAEPTHSAETRKRKFGSKRKQ